MCAENHPRFTIRCLLLLWMYWYEQPLYDCIAVINHYGAVFGGHYTAFGRHGSDPHNKGLPSPDWFSFDDDTLSIATNATKEIVRPCAYALLYAARKEPRKPQSSEPEPAPEPEQEAADGSESLVPQDTGGGDGENSEVVDLSKLTAQLELD